MYALFFKRIFEFKIKGFLRSKNHVNTSSASTFKSKSTDVNANRTCSHYPFCVKLYNIKTQFAVFYVYELKTL